LALGIGTTSAMFSLVDGILLRPLPFPHPDRIVEFLQSYPEKGLDRFSLSQANVAVYRDRVRDFESFAAHARNGATLQADGPAERLVVESTTDFSKVLGVGPAAGAFSLRRTAAATTSVSLVWILAARFGEIARSSARPSTWGQPTRIIGIMPPNFRFRVRTQMHQPLVLDPTRAAPTLKALPVCELGQPGASAARGDGGVYDWAGEAQGFMPPGLDPRSTRMTPSSRPPPAMTGDVARPPCFRRRSPSPPHRDRQCRHALSSRASARVPRDGDARRARRNQGRIVGQPSWKARCRRSVADRHRACWALVRGFTHLRRDAGEREVGELARPRVHVVVSLISWPLTCSNVQRDQATAVRYPYRSEGAARRLTNERCPSSRRSCRRSSCRSRPVWS
jgi:hypothetical protein